MRHLPFAFGLLAVLSTIAPGCSSGNSSPSPAPAKSTTAIAGYVTDTSGASLEGVSVASDIGSTTTDAKGAFRLEASAKPGVVVHFTKDGYVPRSDPAPMVDGFTAARHAVLMPEAPALPLDVDQGGTVVGVRGARVSAGPGAFVDANGKVATGTVDVHLTPYDPSVPSEALAVPGDMSAESATGNSEMLESFGMLDITVKQDGKKLQVAPGQTIEIHIPASANGSEAQAPLWYYDENAARWVEQGTLTLDPAEGAYVAKIPHMSLWNCDKALERTCIQGHVVDAKGAPVAGVLMAVEGKDYNGVTVVQSGPDGQFSAVAKQSSQVDVYAYPGGEHKGVTTGTAPSDVPPANGGVDCQDIGNIVIDPGSYFPQGSSGGACDLLKNPFAGSCAAELGSFGQCFQPSGDCTVKFAGGGQVMEYGSGASVKTSGTTVQYLSPQGVVCATTSVDVATQSMKFALANGSVFTFAPQDNGDLQITCPSGQVTLITAADSAAFSACAKTDSNACKVEGTPGSTLPTLCTTDADCSVGTVCCDLGTSTNICLDGGLCDMAKQAQK